MRRLVSALFWLFFAASSLVYFPVSLALWALTAPFDRRRVVLHRFASFWASTYTWLNPAWQVEIEGRERIRSGATYVMVANHQSLLDILVLYRLWVHFKWVSKVENFRVPVIGWNMSLCGYIKLVRGDRQSVQRMFVQAERALRAGSSLMMFPEGTRSTDGRMRPFREGAFLLAQRAGVPVLPIAIGGTGDALPRRGFVLRGRHAIRVQVLEPLAAQRIASVPPEAVASEVRARIAEVLQPAAHEQLKFGFPGPDTARGHRQGGEGS